MRSTLTRLLSRSDFSQPDVEIAGCITDIGINFTVADLQKPNPQIIQKVFEWLAELLMNTTRDVVAPAMRAAADDVGGPEAERLFTSDTRDLMGFFVILRKLLREVVSFIIASGCIGRNAFVEEKQNPG